MSERSASPSECPPILSKTGRPSLSQRPGSLAWTAFATRSAFFIAGAIVAIWAPMVPYVKEAAGLSDGALGLLLLLVGFGAMLAMPLSAGVAARFGCRATIIASSIAAAIFLPSLILLPVLPWLLVGLPLLGFSIGMLDVVMNIEAVIVERAIGRPMMSGFHAFFSIGALAGALIASLLLKAGLSHLAAATLAGGLTMVLLSVSAHALLAEASGGGSHGFALPRGRVLLIGAACFIVFLTEGAVLDWSGIFAMSYHAVDPALAGFAYAAFATAMAVGRLLGDRVVARLGGRIVILAGGCAAALGGLWILLPLPWPLPLAGFALIGLGCANIVPVLFSATGRQTVMPANQALGAITTVGYAGVLAGPALVGAIAQGWSLATAFASIASALLVVALVGPFTIEKARSDQH